MLAEIFFYGIVIYLIYKIVFDFIFPVLQTGKQMKQKFKDVNEHMRQQTNNFQQQNNKESNARPASKKVVGDYIDFEEVKK